MKGDEIDRAKQSAREKVWTLLERERAAPLGVHGHIPKFEGADQAAGRLAAPKPFYLLDPAALTVPFERAATSDGASSASPTIGVDQMRRVDLIVCGSVVVNRSGVRVGKGAGYSDIEVALLTEAGLIGPETAIVTTVHQLQVVDDELPETEHDFSVDMIVTPDEVIECGPPRRPNGIVLRHLTEEKIAAIPVLAGLSSSLTQRR